MQHISEFDPALSVNELLRRHPEAVRVLATYGIDTCCGGAAALAEAAKAEGADVSAVLASIADATREVPS
jgi:regulator of cell morphogenesis and NO signaling